MKRLRKIGILVASFIAIISLGSAVGAFAANTDVVAPKGFNDPITIDVSATNEALNYWQYYISNTLDEDGNLRGDALYEDKNVHFKATENGRTGNAIWVEKKTQSGSLTAYPYASGVESNRNYILTAYVKSVCEQSDENSISFMIKELDENGAKTEGNDEFAVHTAVKGAVSEWKKVEFTFVTSANASKIVPKIEFKGKGDFYLDDMSVRTSTVSSNTISYKLQSVGKVSDGANDELSNADEKDGKPALKGMSAMTSENISSDSSDGDGASLMLNDGEVFKTNFSALSQNKTYRLSFKYKHIKIGSKNALSIRMNYYTTAGERRWYVDVVNGSATEWLTCSLDFKGAEAFATQGLSITASARYLIDELSIICLDENDSMQYIANGSFSGGYTDGYTLDANANVAKQSDGTGVFATGNGVYDGLFGQRGFVRYAPVGLTVGQKYTLSYEYRFAGASWVNSVLVFHGGSEIKNIINQEVPDGWNNATYEFTATGSDYFMFYGPSYYFWVTYYKDIKVTSGDNQYNSNVDLVKPEPVYGENVLDNGMFDGNTEYVADGWTFKGNAGVYGLIFDTRYEANVPTDTKPDWKICLDGTKGNAASAISKEIMVDKKTLFVGFTCYNGKVKDLTISAIAGDDEIFADENGFIELPDGVTSVRIKFSSEKYVSFKKITVSSHVHATPSAEEITVVEATCTKHGGKVFTCKDCGKVVYLEKTATLAHDLEHVHIDATCVDGVDKDVCKVCKGEFNVKVLAGNTEGHKFKEEVLKAPTCGKSGMKQSVCEYCGAVKDREIISATGKHVYKDGVCEECGAEDPEYDEPTSESSDESESGSGDSGDGETVGSESKGGESVSGVNSNSGSGNGGCGLNVYSGVAALGTLAVAAIIIIRRKKDE